MPPITSCIYDQKRVVFHCVDEKGKEFELVYNDPKSDKLVCIPFHDFGALVQFCKDQKVK